MTPEQMLRELHSQYAHVSLTKHDTNVFAAVAFTNPSESRVLYAPSAYGPSAAIAISRLYVRAAN